ncbi:mechanosensitive ion channel domain-containing protein [Pseudotenacibaculum sp. MALMAid0570]|uniref:mechanosensitive ion channel domain-containing protein n=1 Tax=Pseudotenacibaculum sp. MALMAid0570 TaxID=3143938 RepID=UPI0032DF52C5
MDDVKLQIVLIVAAFLVLISLMAITKRITKKVTLVKNLEPNRKKVVENTFYFAYYVVFFVAVILILGIKLEDLSIFFSSLLAIIGIAFFAQWSLLSNLTASVIIFFYHPLKIGDRVKVLDKEFDFSGTVKNMTGFYVLIETDEGREVTVPNSIILQKGTEFLNNS